MFAGIVTNLSHRGRGWTMSPVCLCSRNANAWWRNACPKARVGNSAPGLDDFSSISNLKGHIYGDSVLRQFAQNVQRLLPFASIYRHGGGPVCHCVPEYVLRRIALLYEVINGYSDCRHEVDGIRYYCYGFQRNRRILPGQFPAIQTFDLCASVPWKPQA